MKDEGGVSKGNYVDDEREFGLGGVEGGDGERGGGEEEGEEFLWKVALDPLPFVLAIVDDVWKCFGFFQKVDDCDQPGSDINL